MSELTTGFIEAATGTAPDTISPEEFNAFIEKAGQIPGCTL